jgi:hypothetical protein
MLHPGKRKEAITASELASYGAFPTLRIAKYA